jgi:hypothetical protein
VADVAPRRLARLATFTSACASGPGADAGEEVAGRCTTCHSVADPAEGGRTDAVVCEACHEAADAFHWPGLPGDRPEDAGVAARMVDAPHPLVVDASLPSGRRCLVCHAELRNPAGVAV